MKKILLIAGLASLVACTIPYSTHYITDHSYIGMPLADFKKIANMQYDLVKLDKGYAVYEIKERDENGRVYNSTFFYFDANNQLYKIDHGEFWYGGYPIEVTP